MFFVNLDVSIGFGKTEGVILAGNLKTGQNWNGRNRIALGWKIYVTIYSPNAQRSLRLFIVRKPFIIDINSFFSAMVGWSDLHSL